ncbi:MAG: LLM class flavin-dependent oxidoreductase [Actinomycetota bacterium]|nr:LLM class flavin-dependent oxidoreductase [Actinomycetota bacterium]
MQVDVLFDPFGGRWRDMHQGALAAEQAGFDGVWIYDHLAGSVHGASGVLECWTSLTAIATAVPGVAVGPLVLNVANRHPGTLAVMAATLQEVSDGRLLLGVGAGGGVTTPYGAEQHALGRPVGTDRARRGAVEDAIATLRAVWSGTVGGVTGYLRPEPLPPIVVGGFGPKMAELAGRSGDGINLPAGRDLPQLIDIARRAHAAAGRDPARFVVTASAVPSRRAHQRLSELGVDRFITVVGPPYVDGVRQAAAAFKR